MQVNDIMKILQEDMKVAIIASVDEDNQPHARPINIGVANEDGIFFMTSPKTNFYQQLTKNPYIAITALKEEPYLIQVIRVTGKIREMGREGLEQVIEGNPYIEQVYPQESDRQAVQVFQLYEGEGFYHSLTQGHRYTFKIGK